MPSLAMHEQDCLEKLGKPFTHVHEWLDELWPILKLEHRKVRHNETGIQYVRTTWGDKAAEAARLHISLDEDWDYVDGLWVRKEKGGQDDSKAL